MPPFSQSPNSSSPDLTKVGPLKDEKNTAEYLEELDKPGLERKKQSQQLEEEAKEIQKQIDELRKKENSLRSQASDLRWISDPQSFYQHRAYAAASDLYETSEGTQVASLPERHPVMESIRRKEILERLEKGTQNLFEMLRKEEENRKPVDWNPNNLLENRVVPQSLHDLVVLNKGSGPSYEEYQKYGENGWYLNRNNAYEEWLRGLRKYFDETMPSLLEKDQIIDRVKFFTSKEKTEEGEKSKFLGFSFYAYKREYLMDIDPDKAENFKKFTGVDRAEDGSRTVYKDTETDLYLVMADGRKYRLKDTDGYKTYVEINENGPDFAGHGKTRLGRFVFTNYLFKQCFSSGSETASYLHKTRAERQPKLTTGYVKEVIDSGKVLDGIDPDTYFDEKTGCLVMDRPLFVENAIIYKKDEYGRDQERRDGLYAPDAIEKTLGEDPKEEE